MQLEFMGDELEWIDQQMAGVRASIERLRSEIGAYEDQLARLCAAREAVGSKIPAGAIRIPLGATRPRPRDLS